MGRSVDMLMFLSRKFVGAFTPRVLLGLHVCDVKDYGTIQIMYIILKLRCDHRSCKCNFQEASKKCNTKEHELVTKSLLFELITVCVSI